MSKDDIIGILAFTLLWVLIYSVIHVWIWIQQKHPLKKAEERIDELQNENILLVVKLKEAEFEIKNYKQKEEIEDLKNQIHNRSTKRSFQRNHQDPELEM